MEAFVVRTILPKLAYCLQVELRINPHQQDISKDTPPCTVCNILPSFPPSLCCPSSFLPPFLPPFPSSNPLLFSFLSLDPLSSSPSLPPSLPSSLPPSLPPSAIRVGDGVEGHGWGTTLCQHVGEVLLPQVDPSPLILASQQP